MIYYRKKSRFNFFKLINIFVVIAFSSNFIILPPQMAYAQNALSLPLPGVMVNVSPVYCPVMLRGIKVQPDKPFNFNFIVDSGDTGLNGQPFKDESTKLVKYFLASLTVPEKDLWVNLSPYEKDRIIPESFGVTEMGRDMLAQDYLLKQLTASLIYPENELGKKFWDRVYKKAYDLYGTTEIPLNTFNKVWIVPDKAVVYEHQGTAFVAESRLKVLLEEDYLATRETKDKRLKTGKQAVVSGLESVVLREVVLPEIEKEINEGKNFAQLRQIYHSLILASWYKRSLRESILSKVYVDQNKIAGVDVEDKDVKQKIYEQYLAAYQKGVYNYIKEDYDTYSQQMIPRQYFSGGVSALQFTEETLEVEDLSQESDQAMLTKLGQATSNIVGPAMLLDVVLKTEGPGGVRELETVRRAQDRAMLTLVEEEDKALSEADAQAMIRAFFEGKLVIIQTPFGREFAFVADYQESPEGEEDRVRIEATDREDEFVGFIDLRLDSKQNVAWIDYGFEEDADGIFVNTMDPIVAMGVTNGYQRLGIGRTLLGLAMRLAQEKGVKRFEVNKVVKRARPFYTEVGFRPLTLSATSNFVFPDFDKDDIVLPEVQIADRAMLTDKEIFKKKREWSNWRPRADAVAPSDLTEYTTDDIAAVLFSSKPAAMIAYKDPRTEEGKKQVEWIAYAQKQRGIVVERFVNYADQFCYAIGDAESVRQIIQINNEVNRGQSFIDDDFHQRLGEILGYGEFTHFYDWRPTKLAGIDKQLQDLGFHLVGRLKVNVGDQRQEKWKSFTIWQKGSDLYAVDSSDQKVFKGSLQLPWNLDVMQQVPMEMIVYQETGTWPSSQDEAMFSGNSTNLNLRLMTLGNPTSEIVKAYRFINDKPGRVVLDVGTGNADTAKKQAELGLKDGTKVIAIDKFAPKSKHIGAWQTRLKLLKEGFANEPNFVLLKVDLETALTELPDNSVDQIQLVFPEKEVVDKLLELIERGEIGRVLKAGGKVAVAPFYQWTAQQRRLIQKLNFEVDGGPSREPSIPLEALRRSMYWGSAKGEGFVAWKNVLKPVGVGAKDESMFTKGGIDFDPTTMDLEVQGDGSAAPVPAAIQPDELQNIEIEGLSPVIINIVPATNIPAFFGISSIESFDPVG